MSRSELTRALRATQELVMVSGNSHPQSIVYATNSRKSLPYKELGTRSWSSAGYVLRSQFEAQELYSPKIGRLSYSKLETLTLKYVVASC